MTTDETTAGGNGADGALAVSSRPLASHGGARPGSGQPRLSGAQREARRLDREALERLRRPSILQSARELRFDGKLLRARNQALEYLLGVLADPTATDARKDRIALHVFATEPSGIAKEIADRSGLQKLKQVDLQAFDAIARAFEEHQDTAAKEITKEDFDVAVDLLIAMGFGKPQAIDVPYEEMLRQQSEQKPGEHTVQ